MHIGDAKVEKAEITLTTYSEHTHQERVPIKPQHCVPERARDGEVLWINVTGLHDVGILEALGKIYGLHHLTLEDILNTDQRPKLEVFDDYIFIVLKLLERGKGQQLIEGEQISFVLGRDFLLTFEERECSAFKTVSQRIREGKGRIRRESSDYLAYALIDAAVDNYFLVLEDVDGRIEDLESELLLDSAAEALRTIQILKKDLIYLRRSVWPLREVIGGLERDESGFIRDSTKIYLRDISDHTIHVIDIIESFRDLIAGILELHLSSMSNRMNSIMKVLTMIATVFIPLTFIAGVYGMNFRHMPELEWPWGYPAVLAVMLLMGAFMVFYFRKRKWL
jgi:magnesium transporter